MGWAVAVKEHAAIPRNPAIPVIRNHKSNVATTFWGLMFPYMVFFNAIWLSLIPMVFKNQTKKSSYSGTFVAKLARKDQE